MCECTLGTAKIDKRDSNSSSHPSNMIEISKAAVIEIDRMQRFRQQTEHKFRVSIVPGGCKSFHYTIDLTDITDSNDILYQINGITVAIESQQLMYVENLKLDYSEDLMGGAFRFQNSRSTSVCDCGNSFDL
jgi:iron-sulfur cluster assembly protein